MHLGAQKLFCYYNELTFGVFSAPSFACQIQRDIMHRFKIMASKMTWESNLVGWSPAQQSFVQVQGSGRQEHSFSVSCHCVLLHSRWKSFCEYRGLDHYMQLLNAEQNDIGNFLVSLILALPAG